MCFVWIWEQTAIISLYRIKVLVCITETGCLLRGTDWMFKILFITETGCVYCAVRTGCLTAFFITETGCVYCAVRTGCLTALISTIKSFLIRIFIQLLVRFTIPHQSVSQSALHGTQPSGQQHSHCTFYATPDTFFFVSWKLFLW
jgi:hypothetical protein